MSDSKKYYTTCAFTPKAPGYHHDYRMYTNGNNSGLLFYNSGGIDHKEVLRCLRRLSDLYDDPQDALLISVAPTTIAATFSTSALPFPKKYNYQGDEYLSRSHLTGWYLEDVNDPNSCKDVDYNDMYDKCQRIERLSGACPCPLFASGECINLTITPELGEKITRFTHYENPESSAFRKKQYKELYGFTYVPPSYTTAMFFEPGDRPWEDYDFSLVGYRKKEYLIKGQQTKVRNIFRKEHCSSCVFKPSLEKDCGQPDRCLGHVTESELWAGLLTWLNDKSGFMDMPGFTREQRDYLIASAGGVVMSRAITSSRNTFTRLSGFVRAGLGWKYKVSADRGDKDRHAYFSTYDEAAEVLGLPKIVTNTEPLGSTMLLAAATMGYRSYRYIQYSGPKNLHHLYTRTSTGDIFYEVCSGRYTYCVHELNAFTSSADEFYRAGFGHAFGEARNNLVLR